MTQLQTDWLFVPADCPGCVSFGPCSFNEDSTIELNLVTKCIDPATNTVTATYTRTLTLTWYPHSPGVPYAEWRYEDGVGSTVVKFDQCFPGGGWFWLFAVALAHQPGYDPLNPTNPCGASYAWYYLGAGATLSPSCNPVASVLTKCASEPSQEELSQILCTRPFQTGDHHFKAVEGIVHTCCEHPGPGACICDGFHAYTGHCAAIP